MTQFSGRKDVLAWLKEHTGQRVRLSDAGTTLRVVGEATRPRTLDACSTEFEEVAVRMDIPGLELDLTLQDEALSVYVRATEQEAGPVVLALPLSIPYDRVRLGLADVPDAQPAQQAPEEPEFSPYELLHRPRSD